MESRPLRSLSSVELAAWQDLADDALEPNPFFEPGFVVPASRALDPAGAVHLARIVSGGRTLAAAPVVKRRWRGAMPAVATWRHTHCFLGTPLVRSGTDAHDTLRALSLGLAREAGHRAVVWEQLVDDGPVATTLRQVAVELGWQTALDVSSERAFVTRRAEETYLDHVSGKKRKEYRRQRRRLDESVGGDLQVTDTTADPAAAGRFLRVEAAGWKGEAGTAFMSDPAVATMFREICDNFRDRGRLQLLELGGRDKLAAVKCNLLAGDGAFTFKIGFDETLAPYSPGVQLELDNLAEFHRRGDARWMDSCAMTDNQMINSLWPERRTIASLVLTRQGATGSAAAMALRGALQLRTMTRSITS